MSNDDFLSRWSRRKHDVRAGRSPEAEAPRSIANVATVTVATPVEVAPAPPSEPLQPVESLTPESDFTPFMREGVDPKVRGQALRTLFRDPQFNVMDGLDIYIDDYSKPDPLPEGWLEQLSQMQYLGDAAKVPEEEKPEAAPAAADEDAPTAPQRVADRGLQDETSNNQSLGNQAAEPVPAPKVEE